MSRFIFVHGACHGGWCWFKVVPLLEQLGHTVECPDLPSCGRDRASIQDFSLATCAQKIADIVAEHDVPAILAGHSLGGLLISETYGIVPERVSKLVYISAFLLRENQTINDVIAMDKESGLGSGFHVNEDQSIVTPNLQTVGEVFYNDCTREDNTLARSLITPATLRINSERNTNQLFASPRVSRHYIECLADNAVTISAQQSMHSSIPCDRVWTLNSGHSPFLSVPNELAEILNALSTDHDCHSAPVSSSG
jgi:pimeloyl-ACP methyl ester carboxylesterase